MKLFNRLLFPLALICAVLLVQSCADNPYDIDFKASPDPFDTTSAVRNFTLPNGTRVYVIEEGGGPFEVVSRDAINIRFTARIPNGKIFDGSYDNRGVADQPRTFRNLLPTSKRVQTAYGTSVVDPLVEGLRKGLLGMKEGEQRTIVVPPEMGYTTEDYRQYGVKIGRKTLIYDVELVSISG